MKLQARVSICRSQASDCTHEIRIAVRDETSCVTVLELTMTPEAFACAVTNLSEQPAQAEWRGVERLGLTMEHKIERVPYARTYNRDRRADEAAKVAALAPFEVDGWAGDRTDLGNSHRQDGDAYTVRFRRWV